MKLLLLMLLAPSLLAQTALLPPLPVSGPALPVQVNQPDQYITITTAKNGGKVQFLIPGRKLTGSTAEVKASTAEATAPVTIPPRTLLFECTIAALPDGQPDLKQPLTCTAKAK